MHSIFSFLCHSISFTENSGMLIGPPDSSDGTLVVLENNVNSVAVKTVIDIAGMSIYCSSPLLSL